MASTPSADPRDAEELREEIERTRERLGATLEQLVARADVKRRAKAEAARLAERAKASAAPASLRRAVAQGPRAVSGHRGPALAAACGLITAALLVWQWRKQ
jgi:hypothetical protein